MEPRDAYGHAPPREPDRVSRRALLRIGWSARARADIDYDGVAARVAAGWDAAGEGLLRALEPVAAVAAELAGVAPGQQVLDAGAGDGNVALACAARGAGVDACDIAHAVLRRGRERTAGTEVRWTRADVQALPYPDASFDAVISTFGAALAPRPRRAAAELTRVLRPGGRLVLATWAPRGLPGRLDELRPLPDGVHPPTSWADEARARRRLAELEEVERRARTVKLRFPDADALWQAVAAPFGLQAGHRELLDRLLAAQNNRPPAVDVDARYVLYVGRRAA